jgi:hypothetical protein
MPKFRHLSPTPDAARGRPRVPFAKLADNEPATGPRDARHFPEHKAEHRDGNNDVEALRIKRQLLRGRDLECDRRCLTSRTHPGRFDHLQ